MKLFRDMIIIIATATTLFAQPSENNNRELSLSGSYQNYSSGSSSSGSSAILLSPRLGFYVHKGLELEPELLFMMSTGSDLVYMLNGNVSYNFIARGKTVPFLLIGYGLANTVPFFNVPMTRTDFNVGVLNIGMGVKIFLKEDIALRIEYRYQKYSGQGETVSYGYYSYTQKVDTRINSVQFGFSIFL
ncbi:MAG: outer membrane beta-barrel protein [Ignavibacteriaceae bacterium]